jgi:hypothetical protein
MGGGLSKDLAEGFDYRDVSIESLHERSETHCCEQLPASGFDPHVDGRWRALEGVFVPIPTTTRESSAATSAEPLICYVAVEGIMDVFCRRLYERDIANNSTITCRQRTWSTDFFLGGLASQRDLR